MPYDQPATAGRGATKNYYRCWRHGGHGCRAYCGSIRSCRVDLAQGPRAASEELCCLSEYSLRGGITCAGSLYLPPSRRSCRSGPSCPVMPRPAAIDWARLVITGIVTAGVPVGSTRTIASAGTAIVGTVDISCPLAANDAVSATERIAEQISELDRLSSAKS